MPKHENDMLFVFCSSLVGVSATLTWPRRMKIALDAAKGLAFLHGAERSIIYRDFKTSNILLDTVSCSNFVIFLAVVVLWEQ